jgi:hypothetical protein
MYEINCLIGKCRNFQRFLLMQAHASARTADIYCLFSLCSQRLQAL